MPMKIDLQSIDKEQFMMHEHIVNGETLTLVQPQHIGTKWRQNNKHLRSAVFNFVGELVSAGLPKFTNWGENPENFPVPTSLSGATIMEKMDGSLLIVSKYKGYHILRTRGTVNARQLDNGYELDIFERDILPKLKDTKGLMSFEDGDTWPVSFLFEWVSPVNKIVLSYGDQPDWILVGIVGHTNYDLVWQSELDRVANVLGLKRPQTYTFTSVDDLLEKVEWWKGKEGVCVYSKDGQMIHKVKGAWYLFCHRMKTELGSTERVVDVFMSFGMPTYQEFFSKIETQFDYELATQIQGDMSKICDAWKDVLPLIEGMKRFVEPLKLLPRKDAALKIMQSYGDSGRSSMCFCLLDGKILTSEQQKKLLWQKLK